MESADVLVVGAGVAGLAAGITLERMGVRALILEADDDIGGRIRTDVHPDGFLLDRGFQVLLTAYPTVNALLDLDELELQPFAAGARIKLGRRFVSIADPRRHPGKAIETLMAPIGSFADKLRILRLVSEVKRGTLEDLQAKPEQSIRARLGAAGFSDSMQARFLAPFLRGITLDPDLTTSSRFFDFVWRMFASGPIALPARGMQEIPRKLAARLPHGAIRTRHRAVDVGPTWVDVEGSGRFEAKAVIVATDGRAAERWLDGDRTRHWLGATTAYFAAAEAPLPGGYLLLNGDEHGLIHHLVVLTEVAKTYSSDGRALISVTVLGVPDDDDEVVAAQVSSELVDWFGPQASTWTCLRVVRVPHALPHFCPPTDDKPDRVVRTDSGVWICGDHCQSPSIEGAMRSGVATAEALRGALGTAP